MEFKKPRNDVDQVVKLSDVTFFNYNSITIQLQLNFNTTTALGVNDTINLTGETSAKLRSAMSLNSKMNEYE